MTENRSYNTKSRKYILEFLKQNCDTTVAVSDILDYLGSKGISVNFTTVYRYLNKLTREREVIKLADEGGQRAVYQFIGHKNSCDEHIHIQCTKCGKLEHVECEFMEHIKSHFYKDHGFTIKCDGSIIYGVCADCENKIEKN